MFNIICVTNRKLCEGDFLWRIEQIVTTGPDALILREKDVTQMRYKTMAQEVIDICERYGVKCILHTFADIAISLECKAIHLPLHVFRDLPESKKALFGTIGVSCHSVEEAVEAQKLGCTYITAGHIFETDCKSGLKGRGLDFLNEICEAVNVPVYAIGGIDNDNISQIMATKAAGVCIMSGFMKELFSMKKN